IASREVAESAVFGKPDPVKGEVIVAFVVLKEEFEHDRDIVTNLRKRIREDLGPIYVPEEIHLVKLLPKTRSGKIMRRVVKAVALKQLPGDISTLENSVSVDEIKAAIESFRKEAGD
ncbi:MAG: acetyl-coenzyme A synthetase, partial [Candidatus Thermoplasmatota archaeon]|nr:acetyl-coenzyme A synthetase [Candidatus Thermoplasmatota archaeon]